LGTYGEAAKARGLPTMARADVQRITISHSGYGTPPSEARQKLAKEKLAGLAEQEATIAAIERDRLLDLLAAEVESIRADLPRQAAAYAVELGVIARNLKG
jgi:hypothetical protein